MAKIDVNKAAEIIKGEQVEPATLRRIVEKMNLATQPKDGDEKAPAIKKQWAVLLSDPDGKMPKHDFVAWVLQLPESESVATTVDRVCRAAYTHNATKKGQLMPVRTIGEAIENIKAATMKDADVWVKTRIPVLVVRTSNEIPKE